MEEPTPFKINVSDDLLNFITQRVETARIPPGLDLPEGEEWSYGVPPPTIHALQKYWVEKYDWRAIESRLNTQLKQFTLPITVGPETLKIHFVHHRSSNPGAIPLLFQHGWPGSFLEVSKIINLLTSPPSGQAYHVVAPSLPGFAFSSGPKGSAFGLREMAIADYKLMQKLGYGKYVAQGGDWGSIVVRIMGSLYPESCVAVHVNMLPSGVPSWWWNPLVFARFMMWAPFEGKKGMLGRLMWWMKDECGYQEIQGTKPQALSYALVDSPLGMLAWIRDKLEPLVDRTDFEWEDEEVITWAMMYIIPGGAGHANIYKNLKGKKLEQLTRDLNKKLSPEVDFGASVFPYEIYMIPQWWAACTVASKIVFWKEHERGGHFSSTEKPRELVEDIRAFTGCFGQEKLVALRESGKEKR